MASAPPADTGRLRYIFNHDIMGCTADGVTGNHLYSGRVLGATEPGDVVQLHPDLAPELDTIVAHYARVGISHSTDIVWDLSHGPMAEYPDHAVSVFFFGPNEHAARADEAWLRTVEAINSKNTFMEIADRLDVPVPVTISYDEVARISAADVANAPYPCYLKAAVSVSGVGIYRCATADELEAAAKTFEPGTPVQIQQEVVTDCFLNLQYIIAEQGLRRHAATEQLLDGFVHQGNRHPARHAPWDSVEPMAQWMHEQGMRGVFAFDVAVVGDEDPEFLAIECNPRYNGASYPTAVAHKLGVEQWLAKAYQTRHRSLADLDLSGIEFDPVTGTGVVLVNWGPILVGKLLVMFAGDEATQQALEQELLSRL